MSNIVGVFGAGIVVLKVSAVVCTTFPAVLILENSLLWCVACEITWEAFV